MSYLASPFEKIAVALMILALLATSLYAHETDQFTVPDQPLADLGPELTVEIAKRMQNEMDILNKDMDSRPVTANDSRQSVDLLAQRFMQSIGTNPFQTEFEGWIEHHEFKAKPAVFQVNYDKSVFNGAAITRPLLVFALSATININNVYLGLDKMGHFFQQGHEYFEKYSQVIRKEKATRLDALKAAICHGIDQENGIFGAFTIGVYSNADMAANYAGLHFYLNLVQPVSLGGTIYPPIVELHEGRWRFRDNKIPPDMFTRFITDQLNEAINAPCLSADIRGTYEKNVAALAPRWVSFYQSTRESEEQRQQTLSRWFGEPYGYAGPDNVPSICKLYYDREVPLQKPSDTATADAHLHSPGM